MLPIRPTRLRLIRQASGVVAVDFARTCGIKVHRLYAMERGEVPAGVVVEQVAAALAVSPPEALFDRNCRLEILDIQTA